MELTVKAYPKINIGLYVGKKREDGYHEISSLFHLVKTMSDILQISCVKSPVTSISVTGLEEYTEEKKSTVYKACEAFLSKCALSAVLRIHVEKHIPAKAGLGGGSSDAASVILALDKALETHLSLSELIGISLCVGSDVPFFIYGCTLAYVSGRGEYVTPLEAREDLSFEIAVPQGSGVSTASAYALLDSREEIRELPSCSELYSMYLERVDKWNFRNDFEAVNDMRSAQKCFSDKCFLSGSGSAVYTVHEA